MASFSSEKSVVRETHAALDSARPDQKAAALAQYMTDECHWRGMHPFHERTGPEAIAEVFWHPLCAALHHLQRREDIFMAGRNEVDGFDSTWVVSMGHLMGLFDASWLGIPPTGKLVFLHYCEFNRIRNGRITEQAMFVDIPHLMLQAGLQPFPAQTGAQLIQPGPQGHDGLLLTDQPEDEGRRTLAAINAMIADLGQWNLGLPLEEELARNWHDDMIWWGPAGIGATYTISRYARQHSGPFRAGFANRSRTGHLCRLAEGHFGGFFGWPNFTAVPTGGFMGMPSSGKPAEFRVVDLYRRRGDKLVENWVLIDLLHVFHQQGLDVLGRMASLRP